MEPTGKVVSPYLRELTIIEMMIEAGGRAMAYKAHDAEDREYFLKAFVRPKMNKELIDDRLLREQADICRAFERKQESLYMEASKAQIDCEELVRFYDFFPYRGVYYTVYDFIVKAGVGELDREGLHTKVLVLSDAAAGLARLHKHGILHGDVKPDNILTYRGIDDREGKQGEPALRGKLIDYDGGCLITDPPSLGHRLLDFDDIFAAPEFIRFIEGAQDVKLDPKMDVFSLSMTAARILVGSLPIEPVEGVAKGAAPLEFLKLGELPPPISGLIVRGLAIDPSLRPSAAEFHSILATWLGRRAVSKAQKTAAGSWFDPFALLRTRRAQPQIDKVVSPPPLPTTAHRRSGQHRDDTTAPPPANARRPRSSRAPRLQGIKSDGTE